MPLWAGIDEAGYGPQLGPLVVAGTAFYVPQTPEPGMLWRALADAVVRSPRGAADRLVVNDSKKVNTGPHGLRRLEEGVLSFLPADSGCIPGRGAELLALLTGGRPSAEEPCPWFRSTARMPLPTASNVSAVRSKAALLAEALQGAYVHLLPSRACVVFPPEFNRIVTRTRNKSLLLFQKCGLILQELWQHVGPGRSHVFVDKHGGRMRYRRLARDVFPDCSCDVDHESDQRSVYVVRQGDRELMLTFAEKGDVHALPTALASMTAKYLRELHMLAFNDYWRRRVPGLKPTAGYYGDSERFLADIADAMAREDVSKYALIRCS